MTPEQKKLVQTSFTQMLPASEAMVARFYQRLFELDPSLKPLFKVAIIEQERKLLDMLAVAVVGLDHPAQLLLALQRLGERHVEYGVKPEHYETLRVALLWAFEQALGDHFTPPVRAAWQAVFELMSNAMLHTPPSNSNL